MSGAKQPQRGRVVEIAQPVQAHGVQTLQRQAFAVVEGQRNVDGLDELQIGQASMNAFVRSRPAWISPSAR